MRRVPPDLRTDFVIIIIIVIVKIIMIIIMIIMIMIIIVMIIMIMMRGSLWIWEQILQPDAPCEGL